MVEFRSVAVSRFWRGADLRRPADANANGEQKTHLRRWVSDETAKKALGENRKGDGWKPSIGAAFQGIASGSRASAGFQGVGSVSKSRLPGAITPPYDDTTPARL